jgi:ankyrin repeat protein
MTWQVFRDDPDYLADRADGLLASAVDGTPSAVAEFDRWSAPLTTDGARLVLARGHGFDDWASFVLPSAFAAAFRLVEARDVDGLTALVDRFPGAVDVVGTSGNDLLGLASATCDERLVTVLLARGADVAHANVHGSTALHQAGYANLPEMARVLLDAGAPTGVFARGHGGTPLTAALFWGNVEVARVLAAVEVAPHNLRTAAGLDDVELLATAEPLWGREFYHPHSGFPAWRPSDSLTEARDEAVSWAARCDAVSAITWLAARGADLDADVYRGTPLIWAAAKGRVGAVRRLLDLGAGVNVRGTFGGPRHGVGTTALHHAAESGHVKVIEELLAAGANTAIEDEVYRATAAGWAAHNGQIAARDLLAQPS